MAHHPHWNSKAEPPSPKAPQPDLIELFQQLMAEQKAQHEAAMRQGEALLAVLQKLEAKLQPPPLPLAAFPGLPPLNKHLFVEESHRLFPSLPVTHGDGIQATPYKGSIFEVSDRINNAFAKAQERA